MHSFDLSGITHITQDSRQVAPGALFVALRGGKMDGTAYIPQAESLGAVAVLVAEDSEIPPTGMRIIRASDPRRAFSQIAAQFYPGQPAHMTAVTGTDGKTSTAEFYRQLVHLVGGRSASIGTLGVIAGDGAKLHDATHTTPDPLTLHRTLSELAASGVTHACLEASSHGLDQYRLHGVRLEAAAFTNIARDHLDYHQNEEDYFAAKLKLFSEVLPQGGIAIINADDARAGTLRDLCTARGQRVLDFGWQAESYKILALSPHASGQSLHCRLLGEEHRLAIPLVGAFQAMNILAAIALAQAGGIALAALLEAVPKLQGVAGRLELAATTKDGAAIYVDYAHTPAALSNILSTLRAHTDKRLHVVFGCGGDRDAGKRAEMGKIACELADVAIITDDNPRTENPATIRNAIMSACGHGIEIEGRAHAIRAAVGGLEAGDVLVIAGKGHEKTQIIGNIQHPHDDVMVAREAALQA